MRELLKVRKYKAGYEVRTERLSGDDAYGGPAFEMHTAYTSEGAYIGDSKWAYRLCKKRGIKPELRTETSHVCSIGFCETKQKWYGWSHRAIFGFGVGSYVSKGDIAFVPSNKEERIEALLSWYSEDMYSNVRVVEENGGLAVKYVFLGKEESVDGSIASYGRGEWTAQTLEDAREMACDFAAAVS